MLAQHSLQDVENCWAASTAWAQKKDAVVRPGLVPANVRKGEVQRDKEASLGTDSVPYRCIARARETLVVDAVGWVACASQSLDVRTPQILIELQKHGTQRRGSISSSRVRFAA